MYRSVLALLFASVLLLSGCTAGQKNMPQKTDEKEMTGQPSDMSGEGSMYMDTTENVIYLAGGCFWGMEQLMQSIPGVIDAESGYANGTCEADADYKTVCKGETGFRETVRVEYDPGQVSLDALLLAYFYVIDPTVQNRQGNDRGSQYQTGVYFRTLPLIPAVGIILLEEKEKQEMYRRLFKKSYCRDYLDYICVDQCGKLLRPNYVTEHFSWLIEKYGLRKVRFHDLRHTCASLLLSNGISMKQIQIWLGHSTFSTTADIYAHLDYSAQEASAR